MAEPASTPTPTPVPTPSSIPQKRPLQALSDDHHHHHHHHHDHPQPPPPPQRPAGKLKEKNVHHREPREKKDSWRKRETILGHGSPATTAAGNGGGGGGSGGGGGGGSSGSTLGGGGGQDPSLSGRHTRSTTPSKAGPGSSPGLVRYRLPAPQFQDFYGHRAPPLTLEETPLTPGGGFYSVNDHPINRRGFRYSPCEASHLLPALSYRGTEYAPFTARINFEDMNPQVYVSEAGTAVTTAKGWRMARANVGVREGDWYYECKITNGMKPGDDSPSGHVRIGWARREAPLDAPVGFDAYSYGLRDQSCHKLHMSRPKELVAAGSSSSSSFVTGDVIGLHISLPPLSQQRDISSDATARAGDIIRDRLPIRFKNQLWFEHFEYQPTKEYEDLMNPATASAAAKHQHQHQNQHQHAPKVLPGSAIRIYRNGEFVATAFEDLFALLPPASKPLPLVGGRELDDGSLGYYPAVSVFKGGAVEVNFGPEWLCPPRGLGDHVRAVCERYDEQIAEDVLYDMVDEVDLLFTPSDDVELAGGAKNAAAGAGRKEVIKEMVMDDE